jgi:hypothetical protein
MSQKEKVFADGFSFKRKENAPEFVVGRQSIKVDAAIAFLQTHQKNGWVNLDIKIAKGGNYYCELDTWTTIANLIRGKHLPRPKRQLLKPQLLQRRRMIACLFRFF